MNNVVNITEKLRIRGLENKISRIEYQYESLLTENHNIKTESFNLMSQNLRLIEEIDELKRLLKVAHVEIVND